MKAIWLVHETSVESKSPIVGETRAAKDFNMEVKAVLDEIISKFKGPDVLASFYKFLEQEYDVIPDEVPYRLDTLFHVLNYLFDEPGVQTIEMFTAKGLYEKFGLSFTYFDNLRLQDYVNQVKKELEARKG